MRIANSIYIVLVFLIGFLSLGAQLQAQKAPSSRVNLRYGMTYSEVQALWGEPSEVIEKELIHQSIWRYPALKNSPATTLRFVKGTLVVDVSQSLKSPNDSPADKVVSRNISRAANQSEQKDNPDKSQNSKPQSFMALNDQKELSEILKEVPNEPEGGDKAGPGRNATSALPVPIE